MNSNNLFTTEYRKALIDACSTQRDIAEYFGVSTTYVSMKVMRAILGEESAIKYISFLRVEPTKKRWLFCCYLSVRSFKKLDKIPLSIQRDLATHFFNSEEL